MRFSVADLLPITPYQARRDDDVGAARIGRRQATVRKDIGDQM